MSLQNRLSDLVVAIRERIAFMVPRLMPYGGQPGEALVKTSGSDFDVEWKPTGGSDERSAFAAVGLGDLYDTLT